MSEAVSQSLPHVATKPVPITDLGYSIVKAGKHIEKYLRHTELQFSEKLSTLTNAKVYVKWENRQKTGSFKVRGACYKVTSLGKDKGIICASTGNHAIACGLAARLVGQTCKAFVPSNISSKKLKTLREAGVEVAIQDTTDASICETRARKEAAVTGRDYVSPYNDVDVIAGQGTLGMEILDDFSTLEDLESTVPDYIFVSVGGGGLISGIGAAVKHRGVRTKIIGCQPSQNACMLESLQAGHILSDEEFNNRETLSEGTAGGLEPHCVTFDLCRKLVDDWLVCSEAEIKDAMRITFEAHGERVEAAAVLPLACLIKHRNRFMGKSVVLVSCGGNYAIEGLDEKDHSSNQAISKL